MRTRCDEQRPCWCWCTRAEASTVQWWYNQPGFVRLVMSANHMRAFHVDAWSKFCADESTRCVQQDRGTRFYVLPYTEASISHVSMHSNMLQVITIVP